MNIDVMDIGPEKVGVFEVVFLLGVLYHLRHPLLALEKVSSVTKEMLILSTWVDMVSFDRPAAAFYPKTELGVLQPTGGDLIQHVFMQCWQT